MLEGIKELVTAKQAQSQLLGWEGAAKWLNKKQQIELVEWFIDWIEQSRPKEVRLWWVSVDRVSINYYITGSSIYIVRTIHKTEILSSLKNGEKHFPNNLHRNPRLFINILSKGLTDYYYKIQEI